MVTRFLQLLWCVVLVGSLSLPAQARAWPETRVGGSPAFSTASVQARRPATLPAIVTVPIRILSLLLCLLIAGPMSASALALARPEPRIGQCFPALSKSASTDLDQTAGTRWESRGCDYDFTSGMCKYLYAQANPVNGVDPSGHFFTVLAFFRDSRPRRRRSATR